MAARVFATSAPWKQRQEYCWSLLSDSLAPSSVRDPLQRIKQKAIELVSWYLLLVSVHAWICAFTLTNEHTHIHMHTRAQGWESLSIGKKWETGESYTLLLALETKSAIFKNTIEVLPTHKKYIKLVYYYVSQKFYFWVCIKRIWNKNIKEKIPPVAALFMIARKRSPPVCVSTNVLTF